MGYHNRTDQDLWGPWGETERTRIPPTELGPGLIVHRGRTTMTPSGWMEKRESRIQATMKQTSGTPVGRFRLVGWFPQMLGFSERRIRVHARLLGLAVLVGIVAGVGAIVFLLATQVVERGALGAIVGYHPEPRPAGEPPLPGWQSDGGPFSALAAVVAAGCLRSFALGTGVHGVRSYAAFRCSVGARRKMFLSFRSPDFVFAYLAKRSNCVSSVS